MGLHLHTDYQNLAINQMTIHCFEKSMDFHMGNSNVIPMGLHFHVDYQNLTIIKSNVMKQ